MREMLVTNPWRSIPVGDTAFSAPVRCLQLLTRLKHCSLLLRPSRAMVVVLTRSLGPFSFLTFLSVFKPTNGKEELGQLQEWWRDVRWRELRPPRP